jgi:hypothetical protein
MTVTLRLTPAHLQVLALVRDRQITWRASTGPFGGFALADGSRLEPSIELVALYELRNAELITVNKLAGHVAVTSTGMRHLPRRRAKNAGHTDQPMRHAS